MFVEDDPFGDEEEPEEEPKGESSVIKGLRRENKKLAKQAEEARKEGFESARQAMAREQEATVVATKLGFSKLGSKYAQAFPEGDITEDGVSKWLTEEFGLELKVEAEEKPDLKNFHATGPATSTGSEMLTPREVQQKVASGEWNEAQVVAAVKGGQVQLSTPNR